MKRAYTKISVNPYIYGMEETMKKQESDLLRNSAGIFSIANSLPKVGDSLMLRIPFVGSGTNQGRSGVSYEIKSSSDEVSFHVSASENVFEGGCPKSSSIVDKIRSHVVAAYPVSNIIQTEIEQKKFINAKILTKSNGSVAFGNGVKEKHGTFLFSDNTSSIIRIPFESRDLVQTLLTIMSSVVQGEFGRFQISIIPANGKWRGKFAELDAASHNLEKNKSNIAIFSEKKQVNLSQSMRDRLEKVTKHKYSYPLSYYAVVRYYFSADPNFPQAESAVQIHSNQVEDYLKSLRIYDTRLLKINEGSSFLENYYLGIIPDSALKEGSVLSEDELLSLYHLPLPSNINTRNIDANKFQKLPIPKELIIENPAKEHVKLGVNDYFGSETPFYVGEKSRFRHMYVIGKTGTGKSTFIVNAALQDIWNGSGVAVFDPHGDLINDIMERFPEERRNDLVYVDISDRENIIGLNFFDTETPEELSSLSKSLLGLFKRLFPDSGEALGPYFESYILSIVPTILAGRGKFLPTLEDCINVMTNDLYRTECLKAMDPIEDRTHKEFWEQFEKQTGDKSQSVNKDEIVPHISTKFSGLTNDPILRPIIGQEKSTINFTEITNEKKILLVNFSGLRDEMLKLVGMLMTQKLVRAIFARARIPEKERVPFFLYVDEFQNFLCDEFEDILSEARKYRLGATIAHQYMDQLIDQKTKDETVYNAVMGNVGTTISFGIGSKDAEKMEQHFGDRMLIPKESFLTVDKYNAYVKTETGPSETKAVDPFHIKTIPTDKPKISEEMKNSIITDSKRKYCRTREAMLDHLRKYSETFSQSARTNNDLRKNYAQSMYPPEPDMAYINQGKYKNKMTRTAIRNPEAYQNLSEGIDSTGTDEFPVMKSRERMETESILSGRQSIPWSEDELIKNDF